MPTPDPSCPFHSIFIIDSNTGLSLVSQNYTEGASYDEDLICGMFKAMESFVNHLAYSHTVERIQEINFQGMRIIYERRGPAQSAILGIAITKKSESIQNERSYLGAIVDEFYETYTPHLKNFYGNMTPFQGFRQRLAGYNYQIDPRQQIANRQPSIFPEFSSTQSNMYIN